MRPDSCQSWLLGLLFLITATVAVGGMVPPTPVDGADFMQMRWGMSRGQVNRLTPEPPDLNDGPMLVYPDTIAGQPCRVVYVFLEDKLCLGFLQFSDTHAELAPYFDDADRLRGLVSKEYDEPQIDKWAWADPTFAEDPALKSEALGLGLVTYELGWMSDRSIVAMRMSGGDMKADILLMYADRRCFPGGQDAYGAFFSDRIGLPSPYFRQDPETLVNP